MQSWFLWDGRLARWHQAGKMPAPQELCSPAGKMPAPQELCSPAGKMPAPQELCS
ncbi:hypothetical protein [Scytonema sp. NUACC26]|uniref:hypothetical protein n=1 Tax=Scytonema sp. NUACC26 TaxID=3140176 RepID=UPI0038B34D9C